MPHRLSPSGPGVVGRGSLFSGLEGGPSFSSESWMGDLWKEYIAFGKSENREGIGCGVKGLNHWHSI